MEKEASSKSGWLAGSVVAAKLALASLALASSAMSIAAPTLDGVVSVAGPAQSLEVAKLLEKTEAKPASPEVAATIKAMLAKHKGLPTILVAPLISPLDKDGGLRYSSAASPMLDGTPDCPVVLMSSEDGASSLSKSMEKVMGAKPSKELGARLFEFEALHEIGHCAQAQAKQGFSHPKLSAAENEAIAAGLAGNVELGEMWQENFADAYSMIRKLEASKGDKAAFAQALSDGRLINAWRQMGRDGLESASDGGALKFKIDENPYKTETALSELLAHADRWLDASRSVESRAAELASMGLARAVHASVDGHDYSAMVFDPKSRASMEVRPYAETLTKLAATWRKNGASQERFESMAPKALIASGFGPNQPFAQAASSKMDRIARMAWDSSAEIDNPRKAASTVMRMAKGEGLLDQAADSAVQANPKLAKMSEAWGKALAAEAGSPTRVAPAGFEAQKALAQMPEGSATLDASFYNNEGKLSRWRAARDAVSAAPKPDAPKGFSYK